MMTYRNHAVRICIGVLNFDILVATGTASRTNLKIAGHCGSFQLKCNRTATTARSECPCRHFLHPQRERESRSKLVTEHPIFWWGHCPQVSETELTEIGVYVSCSVELRSRFWLLDDETIDKLQSPILRFFNLL